MSNQPDLAVDELVALFKALADPTRLRLAALIVDRPRCGQDLAAELGVSTGTVSHHLRVLRQADLVKETRQPPFSFFELDLATLQQALKAVASKKAVREIATDEGRSEEERKILRSFFDGPRLTAIPVPHKKKQLVLEEILRRIPRRKEYEERELSRYIETIFEDFCTVRREWIGRGYMAREGGVYRLTDRGREVIAR